MFNDIKWGHYKPLNNVSKDDLQLLDKLVKTQFPTLSVDYTSDHAKLKLKVGVITLVDGMRVECYPFLDFVVYRLAPVLFSNNMRYMNAFKKSCLYGEGPLTLLSNMYQGYMRNFKRDRTFKL